MMDHFYTHTEWNGRVYLVERDTDWYGHVVVELKNKENGDASTST